MTRALFVTTPTNDVSNHVAAWDAISNDAWHRVTFDPSGLNNDWQLVDAVREHEPDVIFYIGACRGPGLPKPSALRSMREMAPLINIVSDAADHPWHQVIERYRAEDCFDLQVGIDGDPDSPVDLVTLTPVDFREYQESEANKYILLGFSGNATGKRAKLLGELGSAVHVRIRGDDYQDHARFLQRCIHVLNVSWTGSGRRHHVKGRAIEAGWAGAILLEHADSPLAQWMPEDCFVKYETATDIREALGPSVTHATAKRLTEHVQHHYHPAMIYGEILDRVNVDHPDARAAA